MVDKVNLTMQRFLGIDIADIVETTIYRNSRGNERNSFQHIQIKICERMLEDIEYQAYDDEKKS